MDRDVSAIASVIVDSRWVHAAWWPAPATSRDLIAGEILATSFEFGEPTDGIEIGDGVRVSITRA